MSKFIIERTVKNAGNLGPAELRDLSARSCAVLHGLGPQIQWLHSHVTQDKLFCLYIAPDAQLIREHAARGGFPADAIHEVRAVLDPTSAR
ncbi:MAG TPA: DUF4242 domain-containing protein [Verrucomicrobiota bacterium]|nr:DUF4242 domain-containing protein [Verrucomicrobiota bacterium]